MRLLTRRLVDDEVLRLCHIIINSYGVSKKGMPIGNLTSQIFANVYLRELDRFILHKMKPLCYLRYGDDTMLFFNAEREAIRARRLIINFIQNFLLLEINTKNDIIIRVKNGAKFLGFMHFRAGRKLNRRNERRIRNRLNIMNLASYHGLVLQGSKKQYAMLTWQYLRDLS